MPRDRFESVREVLREGVGRVFPGATFLVARSGTVLMEEAVGWTADPDVGIPRARVRPDTVFDLASLTKPLVTAAIAMRWVAQGRLDLRTRLLDLLTEAASSDKADLQIQDLLGHRSGLPAWRPYAADLVQKRGPTIAGTIAARRSVLSAILREPLEAPPKTREIYSDLGYILLGMAWERMARARLDRLFGRSVAAPLGLRRTFFVRVARGVPQDAPVPAHDIAATERCRTRGRVLLGEVHDDNAYVVGGVAGHAGLFGTAREVWLILDAMMDPKNGVFETKVFRQFCSPDPGAGGGGRTLAFDTPTRGASSAGTRYPAGLVGHLGFTGTSFWILPEERIAVILLTNRVHPRRDNDAIRSFRPTLHDAVWEALGI